MAEEVVMSTMVTAGVKRDDRRTGTAGRGGSTAILTGADISAVPDASAAVIHASAVLREGLVACVGTDPPAGGAATVPAAELLPVIAMLLVAAVVPAGVRSTTCWAGSLHSSFSTILGAGEGWLAGASRPKGDSIDEAWVKAPKLEGAAVVVDWLGVAAVVDAVVDWLGDAAVVDAVVDLETRTSAG